MHVRLRVDEARVLAERDLADDFRRCRRPAESRGSAPSVRRGRSSASAAAPSRARARASRRRRSACPTSCSAARTRGRIPSGRTWPRRRCRTLRAEAGIELAEDVVAFLDRVAAQDVAIASRARTPRRGPRSPSTSIRAAAPTPCRDAAPAGSPGRISAAVTHMSSVKFVFTTHVLVVDRAARRQLERLRHLDDDVGLDVPAALERRAAAARRSDCPPARRRRPTRSSVVDLALDQATLVGEVPVRRDRRTTAASASRRRRS